MDAVVPLLNPPWEDPAVCMDELCESAPLPPVWPLRLDLSSPEVSGRACPDPNETPPVLINTSRVPEFSDDAADGPASGAEVELNETWVNPVACDMTCPDPKVLPPVLIDPSWVPEFSGNAADGPARGTEFELNDTWVNPVAAAADSGLMELVLPRLRVENWLP